MGERLVRLIPVGIAYAVLLALVLLGFVLEGVSAHLHALWFVFFLMPFTLVYCVPFGLGVGILAQKRVWYTASYGHRLVAAGTALVALVMLLAWGTALSRSFDIVYLAAVIWPVLASAAGMLIGMYYIRNEEYEEAARLADGIVDDDYDVDDYEYEYEYEDEYEDEDVYADEDAYQGGDDADGEFVGSYARGVGHEGMPASEV